MTWNFQHAWRGLSKGGFEDAKGGVGGWKALPFSTNALWGCGEGVIYMCCVLC